MSRELCSMNSMPHETMFSELILHGLNGPRALCSMNSMLHEIYAHWTLCSMDSILHGLNAPWTLCFMKSMLLDLCAPCTLYFMNSILHPLYTPWALCLSNVTTEHCRCIYIKYLVEWLMRLSYEKRVIILGHWYEFLKGDQLRNRAKQEGATATHCHLTDSPSSYHGWIWGGGGRIISYLARRRTT